MTKKEKLLKFIKSKEYKPMTAEEIKVSLDVSKKDEALFYETLFSLENEAKIIKNKKKRYKAAPENTVSGVIHLVKTGAFAECENEEIFIPAFDLNGAFEKDTVSIVKTKPEKDDKRAEGRIVRVMKRGMKTIIGKYINICGICSFEAFDMRLPVSEFMLSKKDTKDLSSGDLIEAKITKYPSGGSAMHLHFEKLIAKCGEYGADTACLLNIYNIPHVFSHEVLKEAKKIKETISEKEIKNRQDFRNLNVITIDGADSKDLDDAVYVTKKDGIYNLQVHIADVSYYVKYKSEIDKEAQKRTTSVYFPDRVVPMLPEKLSNGICSLNPGADRLTLSVVMNIDKDGDFIDYKIVKGVIRSHYRMVYSDVSAVIEKTAGNETLEKYKDISKMLGTMAELCNILKKRRMRQGYINFNVPEIKFELNEQGKAVNVFKYKAGIANEIIEQFMLMANEAVAKFGQKHKLPFVYRVHEQPDSEKEKNLRDILYFYGVHINEEKLTPVLVANAVNKLKENENFYAISSCVLKCMSKARYDFENLGHFGLGCDNYLHFTSPIRRYPDLQVHRVINEFLNKNSDQKELNELSAFSARAAKFSSEGELRAVEAEREADKIKACEYMHDFIGDVFEGVISSVTDFGLFVSLENAIEGFVSMTYLKDDYYVYEKNFYRLRGKHTNKTYALGDKIKVKLETADVSRRRIDFSIEENTNKENTKTYLKKSKRIIKDKKINGSKKRIMRKKGLKKHKRR